MQMKLTVFLLCLLNCLYAQNQSLPISIDFNRFQAIFFKEQKLKLTFYCTGGNGNYVFDFKNIPNNWKVEGNAITIDNFTVTIRQNWRFSINVTDTDGNYLSQSLLLNFMGAYVGLSSITLPVTGKLQNSTTTYTKPVYKVYLNPSNSKNSNEQNVKVNSSNSVSETQKPKLNDLVSSYPGIDPLQRFTVGFGIQKDTSLTTNLIASSRAVYNPLRDSIGSSPLSVKKQSLIKRQSQVNQTLYNLYQLRAKFTTTIDKLKQDSNSYEIEFNSSKQLVNQCDKELVRLEDLKKKVNNAIKDKQEMIDQYNLQVTQQEITIQAEVKKLAVLDELKKKSQSQNLPNSRALQNLQKTLDLCKKSLVSTSQITQQNRLQIEKIQSQIRMLNIESNEANGKIVKITDDLKNVRQKILSLEEQLRQAKVYETNMLRQKSRLQQIPTTNDIRVLSLQSDINSINSKTKISQNNCRVYEAPISSIQSIINKDREKYNNIINDIKDQTALVDKLKNQNLELKKNSNTLPLQIETLKKEEGSYEQFLSRTSYLCDGRIAQYSKAAVGLKNTNDKIASSQNEIKNINSQVSSAQSQQKSLGEALMTIIKTQNLLNISSPAQPIFISTPVFTSSKNLSTTSQQADQNRPTPSSIVSAATSMNSSQIDQIIKKASLQRRDLLNKLDTSGSQKYTINPNVLQANLNQLQTSTNTVNSTISLASNTPAQQSNATFYEAPMVNYNNIKQDQSQILPISQKPMDTLEDGFKASSIAGFKTVQVASIRQFLQQLKINIGNTTLLQDNYLYTLDDQNLKRLTVKGSSHIKLPLLSCEKSTLIDSAVIRDVGLGYILATNSKTQFRLTFSQCTKIASTSKTNSLKQGTLIYFIGVPVVSLPNNLLLNVNFVFCNPSKN